MKSSPKSKLVKVGFGSNIAQNQVKLGKVIMFPLFGFIYSYYAPIWPDFGPDLAKLIYIFQYLTLFTYIYPHLDLFGYI